MEKFKDVHNFLKNSFPEYLSLIAIGSITNEDKWIKERSDNDILIIFEKFPDNYINMIKDFLKTTNFDDNYTFVPMLKSYWIATKNILTIFQESFVVKQYMEET